MFSRFPKNTSLHVTTSVDVLIVKIGARSWLQAEGRTNKLVESLHAHFRIFEGERGNGVVIKFCIGVGIPT